MEIPLSEQAKQNAFRLQEIKHSQKEADHIARQLHNDCQQIVERFGTKDTYSARTDSKTYLTIITDTIPPKPAGQINVYLAGFDQTLLLNRHLGGGEIQFTNIYNEGYPQRETRPANIFDIQNYRQTVDSLHLSIVKRYIEDPPEIAQLTSLDPQTLNQKLSTINKMQWLNNYPGKLLITAAFGSMFTGGYAGNYDLVWPTSGATLALCITLSKFEVILSQKKYLLTNEINSRNL